MYTCKIGNSVLLGCDFALGYHEVCWELRLLMELGMAAGRACPTDALNSGSDESE